MNSSEPKFEELQRIVHEVYDLESAVAVLVWDLETHMPPGGAQARSQQLATLERLAHATLTRDEVGKLLEELRPLEESLAYDSDEASLVRMTRQEYERRKFVPAEFVGRMAETGSLSYQAWVEARPGSDFEAVRPWLERLLDLSRELCSFYPRAEGGHLMDPLIDQSEKGMTTAEVQELFRGLRAELAPLVEAITAQPAADDSCLRGHYPEAEQLDFGMEVVQKLGYDLTRGRQDKTAHPFMIRFSIDDVRITTRVKENDLSEALFSSIHEAGHAMYEQGIAPGLARTLLARGASAGAHESQSRLWENLVGRSRAFWEHFFPLLQARFPAQLAEVELENFYRAINKVQRSLIRTDADEVTYNLHVMMRFDFELDLLDDKLAIAELPEAWRARMEQDLGVRPESHTVGVMQDVHWFGGPIGGGFQGYTLGNVLSAQFFESAVRACPEMPGEISRGEFGSLHGWLKENIYRHGSKFPPAELAQRATGQPIHYEPYIRYLKSKYGEMYEL